MSNSKTVARLEVLDGDSDAAVMTLVFRRAAAFGDREPEKSRRSLVVGYTPPQADELQAQIPMHAAGIRLGVHLRPIQDTDSTDELDALVVHTQNHAAAAQQATAAGIPIINSRYVQQLIDRRERSGIETNAADAWRVLFEIAFDISPSSDG